MHPQLIAERFTLRPLRVADAPALVAACKDPAIVRWCVSVPRDYTLETAHSFISYTLSAGEQGTEYVWAIDYSGVLAGLVSLHDIRGQEAELGFWAAPELRGRGILTDAVSLMMGFAFDPVGLGLDALEWAAIYGNDASYRVAKKLGFDDIQYVENGVAGRPDAAGLPTRCDAWKATMTRTQWLERNFTV